MPPSRPTPNFLRQIYRHSAWKSGVRPSDAGTLTLKQCSRVHKSCHFHSKNRKFHHTQREGNRLPHPPPGCLRRLDPRASALNRGVARLSKVLNTPPGADLPATKPEDFRWAPCFRKFIGPRPLHANLFYFILFYFTTKENSALDPAGGALSQTPGWIWGPLRGKEGRGGERKEPTKLRIFGSFFTQVLPCTSLIVFHREKTRLLVVSQQFAGCMWIDIFATEMSVRCV